MENMSIHPRVTCKDGKVKNTCKPRKDGGKGKLAKHQAALSARRNAHSLTIKSVSYPAAFKAPGSMKGR